MKVLKRGQRIPYQGTRVHVPRVWEDHGPIHGNWQKTEVGSEASRIPPGYPVTPGTGIPYPSTRVPYRVPRVPGQ
eukprot:3205671-Rhodomonas_salina.1